ncbi:Asp23/Gls24 family envelope stress response protein [Companilactobacillus sp. FL22-1]|uniref:Asp23/Gls24 family envelope stress response protein n=1 Tax=Companilactobacillus sp. FL22-1 TaxID=3373892 RepID=UPI0037545C9E
MTDQQLNNDLVKNSKLTFDEDVIAKIAGMAIRDIEGILSLNGNLFDSIADRLRSKEDITKGINVDVGEKQAAINVEIILEYGKNAHDVFRNILNAVDSAVTGMTGLKVVETNVYVKDVMTKKEWQKQNKQDKSNERVN